MDVLTVTRETDGDGNEVDSIALGHDDHLPRRRTEFYSFSGGSMSFAVTFSNIKINPAIAPGTFGVAPSPPAFDAKAEALFRQVVAAYAHIHSLSGIAKMKTLVIEPESGKVLFLEGATSFQMVRPNHFSTTTTTGKEVIRTVCDGDYLFRSMQSQPGTYEKMHAPHDFTSLTGGRSPQELFGTSPLALLKPNDPYGLVSFRHMSGSMRLGPPQMLNGEPVDTLILQSKGPSAPAEIATFRFLIGHKDHLIRQYRVSDLVPFIQAEANLSDLRVNPVLPASTFQFVPLPGSRAIPPSVVPRR